MINSVLTIMKVETSIFIRLMSSALLELNNQKFIMVKELRMNPRVYSHAFLLKKEGFKFIGRTAAFLLLGAFQRLYQGPSS